MILKDNNHVLKIVEELKAPGLPSITFSQGLEMQRDTRSQTPALAPPHSFPLTFYSRASKRGFRQSSTTLCPSNFQRYRSQDSENQRIYRAGIGSRYPTSHGGVVRGGTY
jgi:hypothetical protein